ncbi:Crp/Fnr family transcriptional regulator [Ramlibacter tataouinensis]|uniref:Signal transduction protein: sensor, cNMP-binding domain-like protein n=1 Tax=Ramlibacter tataouinensis (strain ATCC BAA-407 / DSM 14655 / LMG 21543 / TTB310) TaxID=365046 RepID=F5Y4Q6_RAMTT|nr:Crp/Fnr family transcriptional regulator [Ramlibacter tataouinensis]AEG91374.1 signal transduction protein : sensor, cNMP-binding domain-like protein [Ramlibacter tataouinensis TTB310]
MPRDTPPPAAPTDAPTAEAAALVTAAGPARSAEALMREAGLELLGPCQQLSRWPGLMEQSPLLQDFTAAEADILGQAMLRVRARPGQRLIAEDHPSDWMMLLLAGTVDIGKRKLGLEADHPQAGEVTRLAVLRPGALLGEMSMLDGEPRYASCWALSEVEAAVMTRADVAGLITRHPGVGAKLLVKITQLLAQRLRNTSNQLVRVLQSGAPPQPR